MSEEERNQIMNLVAGTDITDLADLRLLETTINEMEGATEDTIEAVGNYVDGIEETGIAIAKVDLETLNAQLRSSFDILKKIEGVDLGEVTFFTEEEIDTMISGDMTGTLDRDDFYSTSEGFVYLGNSMNELRNTIMESNAILLGMQVDALQRKVDIGRFVTEDEALSDMSWQTVSSWGPDQIAEFVFNSIEASAK
jgi:hypothetical protein